MSTSLLRMDPLVVPLVRGETILDLGCGFGHWGHVLRTHYRPDDCSPEKCPRVVGVEIHKGNVAFCRSTGVYEQVIECDVIDFLKTQASAAYDTILALDIIEHLEKDRGRVLLDELYRVASRVVVVSTPNSTELRGGLTGFTGYNEWEHHLSCWSIEELVARGYRVEGVGHDLYSRLYRIRGMWRLFKTFPILHDFFDVLARRYPRISHTLLAHKIKG
ncbi:MAG: class I SAM-dependent methyltransferase [Kiritimatiellae bacterium]|nr:class I SAM-dependent methyltransferase [Kiritimatiellia bacterium]MDD5521890.1 class I SAM-dependent methyltransferase [Kiritimatiellia bacterium]